MILIADSSGRLQLLSVVFLESEGYEVREVGNGWLAQDVILRETAAVKLVVAALHMSPGDGRELLAFVRKGFPKIKVVIFTPESIEGTEEADELLKAGAYWFLNEGNVETLPMLAQSLEISRAM